MGRYGILSVVLYIFYAQNVALRDISLSRASLLIGSEPLLGSCFAVLWLSEQLTIALWCGGLLIVIVSLLGVRPEGGQS
ncbi:EamA family transporter [Pseudomonas syringae]|uniref:EamA family transporter n=1 Tax=Pseudomonas syringae TaxID=317 RepID=UPI001F857E84|nr:EamA family transporter [Pseudomonas syringae]